MDSKRLLVSLMMFSVAFALTAGPAEAQTPNQLTLSALEGNVSVRRAAQRIWEDAKPGMILSEGDAIKTEKKAFAQLTIEGVGSLSLSDKAELVVDKLKIRKQIIDSELNLKIGTLKGKLEKLKSGSSFKVRTPTSVAAVRGTLFVAKVEVTVGGEVETRYFVAEGELAVEAFADGNVYEISQDEAQNFTQNDVVEIEEGTPEYEEIAGILGEIIEQESQLIASEPGSPKGTGEDGGEGETQEEFQEVLDDLNEGFDELGDDFEDALGDLLGDESDADAPTETVTSPCQ